MGQLANTPSWGVLVNAPVERVHEILSSFGRDLILRENKGWTAAFYMTATDTSDDEAAERLRSLGLVPVYKFDFSKYQFSVTCWDGERWTLLGQGVRPLRVPQDQISQNGRLPRAAAPRRSGGVSHRVATRAC
jgi:hypothetical protein